MEIHGGFAELVEISHSRFDGTLSLMGGNEPRYEAVPYSIHVHHNIFDPKNSAYGIELGTDKMVIDHNTFRGTWTAMQNFGDGSTRIRELTVFNNVADNLWMRFIGLAGQVEKLRVFGNTVALGANSGQNYFITLNSNTDSRSWLIANNIITGSTTNPVQSRQMVLSYVQGGQASSAPRNVEIRNNLHLNVAAAVTINDTAVNLADWAGVASGNLNTEPRLATDAANALSPAAGSPAIDAGEPNIGIRTGVRGAGRDIGAFETGEPRWQAGPDSTSTVQYVWAPTSTVRDTTFVDAIDIPLSAQAGAEIRYTLDGSEPGPQSTLYIAPIRINAALTLKARVFRAGFASPNALVMHFTQGVDGYPLLSQQQPATASSVFPERDAQGDIYAPAKAFDGVTFSWVGWSPAANDARPWLQVDLGSAARIRHVELFTRAQIGDDPAARRNFEIRGSNDPGFATSTVLAAQGSTALPFQGVFRAPVTDPGRYRYIRVAKTANEAFFVTELKVRGDR
jgi:hypothetical protein